MKSKFLALFLGTLLFAGCGLLPKNVEFFQSKVKALPTQTTPEKETQKQAAALAAVRAEDTYRAAIQEDTSTNVLAPAADTALLTRSVSTSLGPPVAPVNVTPSDPDAAQRLAEKLDTAIARLDRRIDAFAVSQDKNVGKKVEGSGLFSVPYFVWIGGIGLFLFVAGSILFAFLKVASLANPGVAVGTSVVQLGASRLARGFGQLIKAGESFKDEIASKATWTADEVVALFKQHHQSAQDQDVQTAIKALTN